MASKKLVLHSIDIKGVKVGVRLPDIYEDIDAVVGITKVTDPASADAPVIVVKATDLLEYGQAQGIRVACVIPGATAADPVKKRYKTVLCDLQKVAGAMSGLDGKTMPFFSGAGGVTVTNANITNAFFKKRRKLG